ncbi:transglycosylase domain-containing protein [Nocardia thailandica]
MRPQGPPGGSPPRRQGPPPQQRPGGPQGGPPQGRPNGPNQGRPQGGPGGAAPGRPNNGPARPAGAPGRPQNGPGLPPQGRPGPAGGDESTVRATGADARTRAGGPSARAAAAGTAGPRTGGERRVSGPSTGERRAAGSGGTTPPNGPRNRNGGSGGDGGSGRRGPAGKKKSPWKIVRRTAYVLLALAIIVPSAVFLVAYTTVSVPKPGDLKTNQVAMIYAADGTSVISKVVPPQGNRTEVSIDQIPPHVRNAVIAAEDRDFYTNPGFSLSGFARAARDNVLGKESAGGGSTITQQYVKNALVGDERSLQRKMHELVISAKMAQSWSKEEILAAYLNTIYFGRGAYGIDAAAKAYFGKPVQELSVAEGAVLAATIQLPSLLDPEKNPTGAKTRWEYVLNGMVDGGNLSATDRAAMQYPKVVPAASVGEAAMDNGPEGLIKNRVLAELSEAGINEQQLNTAGLQITTTIDAKAQEAAVTAARGKLQGEPENLRTAVVSIDPKSGAVRAYYGGEDGQGYDFANAGLPTGSSFKVIGLAANLELGIPLSQMYDSSPVSVHGIQITNVEGEGCGMCTIAEALKRSLNTSFYRMELDMQNGPQKIRDMAYKLGIPKELPGIGATLTEPNDAGPNNGIVLGQYQSRPLDMASAYATLAASGMYHAPHFVQRVVTADGQVLLDRGEPAGEQRVSAAVADNVTAAMKPIAAYSRNHNLSGGRESAAKTGTNQLGDTGANRDAWMVGYTPSLSTAVWVGTEQGEPLKNYGGASIYGSGLPSDIWKATMDGALAGTPNETFPKPAPIKGQAGVPEWSAPYTAPSTTQAPAAPPTVIPPREIFPGVTIPGITIPGAPAPAQQTPADAGPLPGQPTATGSPSTPGNGGAGTGGPGNGGAGTGPARPGAGNDEDTGAGAQPTRSR